MECERWWLAITPLCSWSKPELCMLCMLYTLPLLYYRRKIATRLFPWTIRTHVYSHLTTSGSPAVHAWRYLLLAYGHSVHPSPPSVQCQLHLRLPLRQQWRVAHDHLYCRLQVRSKHITAAGRRCGLARELNFILVRCALLSAVFPTLLLNSCGIER